MTSKLIKAGNKNLTLILVASILALWHGCNSNNYSAAHTPSSKSIIEILVNEGDKSWNCIIKGRKPLTFSAINHISPTGILLYFPDTTLDIPEINSIPLTNEIIGTIEADEFANENSANSRIFIGLNMDRPYSISSDENALIISFPKTLYEPAKNETKKTSFKTNAVGSPEQNFPSASLLKSVTTTSLKNNIIVNVDADGAIMNYNSFAIDNPARIVFDIYDIKSPHRGGQTIYVESKWVKRIRYNPYPDKIRLVLDTEKPFLTKYFSFPTGSGLLIYVGQMPQPLNKKG